MLAQPNLNDAQIWGTALVAAIAARNPRVLQAVAAEAAKHLSPENVRAAKGAASIMAMNNIYYRFTHVVSAKEYQTMRAGLRMNIIGNHGVSGLDFELWSLAVSAINGCVDVHGQPRARGAGEGRHARGRCRRSSRSPP